MEDLKKKVFSDDEKLNDFLEQVMDNYSDNDGVAYIDECYRCLEHDNDEDTYYRINSKVWTDEELIDDLEYWTNNVIQEALLCHFRRIRKLYLNKK